VRKSNEMNKGNKDTNDRRYLLLGTNKAVNWIMIRLNHSFLVIELMTNDDYENKENEIGNT
jgi:hypothetical protein